MDIKAEISDSRAAMDELIGAAELAVSNWKTPRAPGKWSPSQVTEHVARSLDEAANMVGGKPHGFPKMPFFVKPIFKTVFFNRTIRSGNFPSAKTFKAFDPADGPETPAAARDRLDAAHQRYADACVACAQGNGKVASSVFGAVSVADYMRFTTMHTRHHKKQIPSG